MQIMGGGPNSGQELRLKGGDDPKLVQAVVKAVQVYTSAVQSHNASVGDRYVVNLNDPVSRGLADDAPGRYRYRR